MAINVEKMKVGCASCASVCHQQLSGLTTLLLLLQILKEKLGDCVRIEGVNYLTKCEQVCRSRTPQPSCTGNRAGNRVGGWVGGWVGKQQASSAPFELLLAQAPSQQQHSLKQQPMTQPFSLCADGSNNPPVPLLLPTSCCCSLGSGTRQLCGCASPTAVHGAHGLATWATSWKRRRRSSSSCSRRAGRQHSQQHEQRPPNSNSSSAGCAERALGSSSSSSCGRQAGTNGATPATAAPHGLLTLQA